MASRRIENILKVNYKVFEPLEFSRSTGLGRYRYHPRNDAQMTWLRNYIASKCLTRSSDKISTLFKRGAFVVLGLFESKSVRRLELVIGAPLI